MYIELMESDPIFASGRVPRDYDLNYLSKKWKELSDRLNKCGSGPTLTAEEWRKVSFTPQKEQLVVVLFLCQGWVEGEGRKSLGGK